MICLTRIPLGFGYGGLFVDYSFHLPLGHPLLHLKWLLLPHFISGARYWGITLNSVREVYRSQKWLFGNWRSAPPIYQEWTASNRLELYVHNVGIEGKILKVLSTWQICRLIQRVTTLDSFTGADIYVARIITLSHIPPRRRKTASW